MIVDAMPLAPPAPRAARPAPELSVVVPFFNEEDAAPRVLDELRAALELLPLSFEIVVVDDGSVDGTAAVLAGAAAADPRVTVLRWVPNRGQAAALFWGLRRARAAIVVIMDGDGQNDPADIPALLEELAAGADMAVGVRARRSDSWLRRRMSRLANGVRGRLLGDRMRDSGCALKALRAEVIDDFLPIRTLYSFMPALAIAAGHRVVQREVRHRSRRGGRSSYALRAFLWRPLLDLMGVWWYTRRRFRLPPGALSRPAPPAAGVEVLRARAPAPR